ncbi:hypothetical protein [Mongoliitalea daihaiensis]|uniref:hypothetical protein n=1 Tax=Mongoliitalea daihaiensis TaxID=2782006 RepID=UPI001F2C709F|nr:hypothetical protein [Mongoliitalea daihaiensis]UJP64668.1 hypothetical protein IPZ59_17985 [Mongoliitalea daihaiensis]
MIKIILLLSLAVLTQVAFAQSLHLWKTAIEQPQVRISQDGSKAVVFTFDRISTWDLSTGTLIKEFSTYIDSENRWPTTDAKLIDADASLNELIFVDNDKYYRFLMFMNAYSAFPESSVKIQKYHGYVHGNDLVVQFFENVKLIDLNYFVAIQEQGNLDPTKIFSSKKYISQVEVSLDKRAIVFRDVDSYQWYDLSAKKIASLPIKGSKFEFESLPDGWVGAYGASRFDLGFYNYDSKTKEFYKKTAGYGIFQPKAANLKDVNSLDVVRATDEHVYELVPINQLTEGKVNYIAYGLKVSDRNEGQEVLRINFSQPSEEFQAFRDGMKERMAEDFREYKINFNQLPANFKFDYNQAKGREITNLRFLQEGRQPMLGDQEFAIGKLGECSNGGVIVLAMGFTTKGGTQTSNFAVFQYDAQGNLIDSRDLGKTIRSSTGVVQVTNFDISGSQEMYKIHVKTEGLGKAPTVRNYAMGCGNL